MPDRLRGRFTVPNPNSRAGTALLLPRRKLLELTGLGIGSMALAGLMESETARAATPIYNDLKPRQGHCPARAKAVISSARTADPAKWTYSTPKPS